MLAVHGARASACLPHQSMHPELARWLEVCQAMRMPTLFLMSSSSAARMMAKLAVTCSLIAEIKASSPVPDISSVMTPPLQGHAHRQVTSQACLEHFSPSPTERCIPVVRTLRSSINSAAHIQLSYLTQAASCRRLDQEHLLQSLISLIDLLSRAFPATEGQTQLAC